MLLQHVEKLLGADTAAILLVDRDGSQLIARSARGLEDEVRQGVRVPLGMGFAGQIAATRAPVVLDDVGPHTVVNPILWKQGVSSMLGVPLIAGGRLLGVMHVGSLHRRHFSDDDRATLEREATRVARVVSEQQMSSERSAARTLQEHLLPGRLPTIDGLDFAARFVAADEVGVGGDWFDVFRLPDGVVGVVIGDVAGVGLAGGDRDDSAAQRPARLRHRVIDPERGPDAPRPQVRPLRARGDGDGSVHDHLPRPVQPHLVIERAPAPGDGSARAGHHPARRHAWGTDRLSPAATADRRHRRTSAGEHRRLFHRRPGRATGRVDRRRTRTVAGGVRRWRSRAGLQHRHVGADRFVTRLRRHRAARVPSHLDATQTDSRATGGNARRERFTASEASAAWRSRGPGDRRSPAGGHRCSRCSIDPAAAPDRRARPT